MNPGSGTAPATPAKPGQPLTERQQKILAFICGYFAEHGYMPALREIAEGAGLGSASAAAYQMRVLADKGHIQTTRGAYRAISVTGMVSVRRDDLLETLAAALAGRNVPVAVLDRLSAAARKAS